MDSGDGFPLTDLSDQQLRHKIHRFSQTLDDPLLNRLPDGGAKLRSTLKHLHHETARRQAANLNRGDRAESPILLKDYDTGAADKLNDKGDDAFSGELRIFSGEKHNGSRENGSNTCKGGPTLSLRTTEPCSTKGMEMFTTEKDKTLWFPGADRLNGLVSCIRKPVKRKFCGIFAMRPFWKEMYSIPANLLAHLTIRGADSEIRFPMGRENKIGTVVLSDDEDEEPIQLTQGDMPDQCDNTASSSSKESKINYPSREDPESVDISSLDIKCLQPESYLSSPIMNFYIEYLQRLASSTERTTNDYLLFNTYFYPKLVDATNKDKLSNLRRWWKGQNIFQKAYVLLPIHADMHWSLAIICIPAKEDESGLIMLHLDSLGVHDSTQIYKNVKSFLIEEWKYMKKTAAPDIPFRQKIWERLSRRIEKKEIVVPQQNNEYDCGLFVLYFMERFIKEAPDRLSKKAIDTMFGTKWFRPEEASSLRNRIRRLVEEFQSNKRT